MQIKTVDDKALVADIRQKLKENDGYCICALVHEPEFKCMCKEFRDQIERGEVGTCGCGLYEIIED